MNLKPENHVHLFLYRKDYEEMEERFRQEQERADMFEARVQSLEERNINNRDDDDEDDDSLDDAESDYDEDDGYF